MKSWILILSLLAGRAAFAHSETTPNEERWFVGAIAADKVERSKLSDLGMSVDSVMTDTAYGTVSPSVLARMEAAGIKFTEKFKVGGDFSTTDFPSDDSKFHNYTEITQAIQDVVAKNSKLMKISSIGKTTEGRDMWAVQINSSTKFTKGAVSAKPGIVFMGNHHAREHVSAEIPLMLLQFLAANYGKDPEVTRLVDTRDIWIIPMVNPDGVEYDIRDGSYHMHRKNTRKNSGGSMGVDLNRNYGYGWGTGGSSKDQSSDVYMGPAPFSEPETQAIKAFVEARPNLKILLTYHTFSELILYPWGGKNDPIADEKDRGTFEKMAKTMAGWNGYTPEQASDLYIASGDTCDWAWGEHKIFSFTFELSPKSQWNGGFYPGEGVIDKVFDANLKPALYLIDLADDPYRVLKGQDRQMSFLQ